MWWALYGFTQVYLIIFTKFQPHTKIIFTWCWMYDVVSKKTSWMFRNFGVSCASCCRPFTDWHPDQLCISTKPNYRACIVNHQIIITYFGFRSLSNTLWAVFALPDHPIKFARIIWEVGRGVCVCVCVCVCCVCVVCVCSKLDFCSTWRDITW